MKIHKYQAPKYNFPSFTSARILCYKYIQFIRLCPMIMAFSSITNTREREDNPPGQSWTLRIYADIEVSDVNNLFLNETLNGPHITMRRI